MAQNLRIITVEPTVFFVRSGDTLQQLVHLTQLILVADSENPLHGLRDHRELIRPRVEVASRDLEHQYGRGELELPDAVQYAIDDAVWAYKIFMEQEEELAPEGLWCGVEDGQPVNGWKHVAHAWALYLQSIRGFRTDPEYTLELEAELQEEMAGWRKLAQDYGRFVRKGKKESKNLKKIRD